MIEVLDRGIESALGALISDAQATQLLVACPFITKEGVEVIAERLKQRPRSAPKMHLLVITKFELLDFVCEASDLKAIQRLHNMAKECKEQLESSAVYDLPSLHAKLFLTNSQAIVGSANLTHSALFGGNAEICLKISEPAIKRDLRAAFVRLVNQASVVDDSFLELKQKQILGLVEETEKFQDLVNRLGEFQAASRLCRLPVQKPGLKQADYYGQMVTYLKWIQQGNGRKTRTRLSSKTAETLDGQEQGDYKKRLATLRVEFLEAIRVIRSPTKQTVSLTAFGAKVAHDPKRMRKAVFEHILKWCEIEHHDRRLRDLMRPFGDLDRGAQYLTIKALMEKVGAGDSTVEIFRERTSPARSWLQSLGVLEREESKRPFRYKRGSIFPRGRVNLDERINTIVGLEDTLQWLRVQEWSEENMS